MIQDNEGRVNRMWSLAVEENGPMDRGAGIARLRRAVHSSLLRELESPAGQAAAWRRWSSLSPRPRLHPAAQPEALSFLRAEPAVGALRSLIDSLAAVTARKLRCPGTTFSTGDGGRIHGRTCRARRRPRSGRGARRCPRSGCDAQKTKDCRSGCSSPPRPRTLLFAGCRRGLGESSVTHRLRSRGLQEDSPAGLSCGAADGAFARAASPITYRW